MKRRKILGFMVVLALGVLGGLSEAGAMEPLPEAELSPEEMKRRQIAARFLEGSSDTSILVRSMIADQGKRIEFSEYASSARMRGFYPNARRAVLLRNAGVLGSGCFAGCESLVFAALEAGSEPTRIGKHAFAHCFSLCSFYVPASVQELEEGCFAGCSLWCVTFEPDSHLEIIGASALAGAHLSLIVLPESVTTLDERCFAFCGSLSVVIFEGDSQLVRVGDGAFMNAGLSSIDFPSGEGNPPYGISFGSCILENSPLMEISIGGVLADPYRGLHAGTMIIQTLEVSQDIECIRPFCFSGCHALTTVTFAPDSRLVTIGGFALHDTDLRSITLPRSVEELGTCCFSNCSALTSCSFEAGPQLKRVGEYAFSDSGLVTIGIPSSVEELGKHCFAGCASLGCVTFESGCQLTTLRQRTFVCCSALPSICIPASVQKLGKHCFDFCQLLASVTFETDSHLTSIGKCAFYYCSALQTIALPGGVETLGEHCFAFCFSLTSVMCEAGSRLEIGEGVFEGAPQARFVFSHDGEQDKASSED
ncbi:MAG: leucine-rich repeat domain-containing protein [Holosporales bacterium]|nr:leucine-rich repeat domain-containing protein [Holosporales bacterium]